MMVPSEFDEPEITLTVCNESRKSMLTPLPCGPCSTFIYRIVDVLGRHPNHLKSVHS